MNITARSFLASSLLFISPIAPLAAQTIQGTVRDRESRSVIDGLNLTLTNTGTRKQVAAESDSLGRFSFASLKPGAFTLAIERDGRSYTHELTLVVTERVELDIGVPADASELQISASSSRVPKLAGNGFYERYEKGRGQFITREQIEQRNARSLADVFSNLRGVRMVWGTRGGDAILRAGGGAGALSSERACHPTLYLDGVLIRRGGNEEPDIIIEQVERPERVEAIEVYTGAAQLPAAFGGTDNVCGAILIWTR